MRVTSEKDCTCHTCGRDFHYLSIARHRAMHRERKEDCDITYTHGGRYLHKYAEPTADHI